MHSLILLFFSRHTHTWSHITHTYSTIVDKINYLKLILSIYCLFILVPPYVPLKRKKETKRSRATCFGHTCDPSMQGTEAGGLSWVQSRYISLHAHDLGFNSQQTGGRRCYFKINTGKYNRSLSRCVSPNVAQKRETFQDDLRLLRWF